MPPKRRPAASLATTELIFDQLDPCLNGPGCHQKGWSISPTGLAICGQCRRPSKAYLEKMMEITTAPTTGKTACGFCMTGNHGNCSYAIRNGDHGIMLCRCAAEAPKAPRAKPKGALRADQIPHHLPTCANCRRRTMSVLTTTGKTLPAADVDPELGLCRDTADCDEYLEQRRQRAVLEFRPFMAGSQAEKNVAARGGQLDEDMRGSSHRTTTARRQGAGEQTTRRNIMSTTTKTESAFRVKAGGGKGAAILALLSDRKNHGSTRVQIAEQAGATTGRVGEVIRYTLAEGSASEKTAVQAFLDSVPSRKAADKPVATKAPAKKTAAATKKAAAKPAAKKSASKPVAKKTAAKA